jgi:hypothetical protein
MATDRAAQGSTEARWPSIGLIPCAIRGQLAMPTSASNTSRNCTVPDNMTVIMMVRNEADILARVLAHASTLFDRAIIIDHRSTDGSGEILRAARAEWPALEIFDYGVQGYFQEALSTAFARRAFE